MITVTDLTKRFGQTLAVDRLSFAVEPGEVVGFLGPNGAGKTTTVRMMTTLATPTRGTATVAGHDVVREPDAVRIKWPNDILLDGAKCVGILIESERLADGRQAVVVGAGINVAAAPDGQPYGVTTLAEHGFKGNLEDVFRAIASEVEAVLALWKGGHGFADIRAGWLERARGLGQAIRINLPDRSIDGIFHALDGEGRLVLKRDGGVLETHSAGDVFLLGEDTAGLICDKAR